MRPFLTVFWPYIHRYRWLLGLGYVTSMVSAGIGLSAGLIINARLDDALADLDQLERLTGFAALIVSIVVVHALATFAHSYTMSWVGGHIVRNVRRVLFDRILRHGDQLVEKESSGELQTRIIADTVALGDFLGGQLPNLFVTAVSFVGGIAAATPRMDGSLPLVTPARIELDNVRYRYPSRNLIRPSPFTAGSSVHIASRRNASGPSG